MAETEDTTTEDAPDAPQEVLAPKERRDRARAAKKAAKASTRGSLSPEDRHAERQVIRAA